MPNLIANIPAAVIPAQLRRLRPGESDDMHVRRVMHAAASRIEELEAEVETLRTEALIAKSSNKPTTRTAQRGA